MQRAAASPQSVLNKQPSLIYIAQASMGPWHDQDLTHCEKKLQSLGQKRLRQHSYSHSGAKSPHAKSPQLQNVHMQCSMTVSHSGALGSKVRRQFHLRSWHRSLIHGLRVMHEALKMTSKLALVIVLVFVLFTISQNAGSRSMWLMQPQR